MTDNVYFYSGRVALRSPAIANTQYSKLFINGIESVFSSHTFEDYRECVIESAKLIQEMLDNINGNDDLAYCMIWEAKPESLETETASSSVMPWMPSELIRLYIVNQHDLSNTEIDTPVLLSIIEADKTSFSVKTASKILH